MSFSIQRAVSDGSMVLLPISIEYFDRSEISVLFDGVVDARQWAWVGTTDTSISFTPAVANLVEVSVRRSTDISEPRHQFSQGAQFTTESLDEDIRQVLHIAQEAKEGSGLGEVYQDLNFHGFKATNMGNGSLPGDAVNHAQMQVHDATIVGYKDAAQASAVAAAASAASINPAQFPTPASPGTIPVSNPVGNGWLYMTASQIRTFLSLVIGSDVLAPNGDGSSLTGIASTPTGAVSAFAMNSAPTGWLKANGSAVSRTTYANLFTAIGTLYGVGDGSTTFNLPDLRGEFIRGFDDARGVDSGRVMGSAQADAFKSHTHAALVNSGQLGTGGGSNYLGQPGPGGATGDTETRPRNIALLYCIKT